MTEQVPVNKSVYFYVSAFENSCQNRSLKLPGINPTDFGRSSGNPRPLFREIPDVAMSAFGQ